MYVELERKIADLQQRATTLENLCLATKEVLNLKEAAIYLGVSNSFLYKLTSKGDIAFYKPAGKLIYFEKQHLLEWARSNKNNSNADSLAEADLKLQELNSVESGKQTRVAAGN